MIFTFALSSSPSLLVNKTSSIKITISVMDCDVIMDLPEELSFMIFDLLDLRDLINIQLSCSGWRKTLLNSRIWNKLCSFLIRDPSVISDFSVEECRETFIRLYKRVTDPTDNISIQTVDQNDLSANIRNSSVNE